jgi:putative ABC transport system ATP-binding protein
MTTQTLERAPAARVAPRPAGITARGLRRTYGKGESAIHALAGVSLDVNEGELTVVMGPSGSGKSTLMHVLAGLDRPDEGTVRIGTTQVESIGERELTRLRREQIAFVFQASNLVPVLSARENVELPLRLAGKRVDGRHIDRLLTRVGLRERADHRPSELSGGQQQRVAIARAMAMEPKVLFADEPTGSLDLASSREVLALLRESVDRLGHTILMVTHDPGAAATGDRVVFLADGHVVRDVERPTEGEILEVMTEVSR